MAIFEVWETRSGNLLGSFETEAAAVAVVRDAMLQHGRGYVETLALAREEGEETVTLAEGMALAERAEQCVPRSASLARSA